MQSVIVTGAFGNLGFTDVQKFGWKLACYKHFNLP